MLIGIEGELGGGKTLLLVKYLLDESKNKRNILTNLKLVNIPYKELDVIELLDGNTELNNIVIGIDELTVYVDCRMSSSKANLFFSYLVLQSRKRNTDIYYTTQNLDYIDKRIIEHTSITVLCEKIFDGKNQELDGFRRYSFFDLRNSFKPKMIEKILDIRPYYSYYDTNQIISPIFKKTNKK